MSHPLLQFRQSKDLELGSPTLQIRCQAMQQSYSEIPRIGSEQKFYPCQSQDSKLINFATLNLQKIN